MKKNLVYLLSFCFFFTACIVDEEDLQPPDFNDEIELADHTVIVPEDDERSGLLRVYPTSLEFDKDSRIKRDLDVGNILASGVTPNARRGYLRKILSLTESGNKLIVQTEQAKFSEAVLKASISYEKELTTDDFLGKSRELKIELSLSDDSPVSGEITIQPRIIFDMQSNGLSLKYMKVGMRFTHKVDAEIALQGGKLVELEVELLERDLKPITIFIGGIFPLVITPEFEIEAGMEYNGPQLNFGFDIVGSTELFVLKDQHGWDLKSVVTDKAQLKNPNVNLNTEIEFFVKPLIEFEFYDIDNVETEVFVKKAIKGEATIEIGEGLGCELYCEIAAGAEVEVDILGFDANPNFEVELYEFPPFYTCDAEPLSEDILDIISIDIFEEIIDLDMPLNGGLTPPNIEGTFAVKPFILKSSNISSDNIGLQFADYTYEFAEQDVDNNTIKVSQFSSTGAESRGLGSYISGSGNSFTIFTELNGTFPSGSVFTHAEVISGEITQEGIVNFHKAIIMLEDNGDPYNDLIEIGQGRACYDSDLVSPRQ